MAEAIDSPIIPPTRFVILSESEESGAEGLNFIMFMRPLPPNIGCA